MLFRAENSCLKICIFDKVKNVPHILEIPVDKAKSVGDPADWFEANKLHRRKHLSLALPVTKELPVMAIMGLFVMVGMALVVLEDKGILKVKTKKNRSKEDFLDLINKSKSEERLRFNGLIQAYHDRHSKWIPDALIAAIALSNNIELFTYNKKDFDFIPELKLYKP